MKIVHVITGGTGRGGAEGVLLRLISETSAKTEHVVYTLLDMPDYIDDFKKAGIEIKSLNIRNPKSFITNIYKLEKKWKTCPPDVIQCWMTHSNVLFGMFGRKLGIPVLWNIRQSNTLKEQLGIKNYAIFKTSAVLSNSIPYKVINCSLKSIKLHEKAGYNSNFVYIPNGINIKAYDKDKYLSSENASFCIGHIARFDPDKNHTLFIKSFRSFNKKYSDSRSILAGTGVSHTNKSFQEEFGSLLNSSFELLGQIDSKSELSKVYKQMDCLVLSSITEGFPNVLIEAMSFGVPCISTDVGDASEIIAGTGWIIPSDDQEALEKALEEAYHEYTYFPEKWTARRKKAYNRVVENYSIEKMCERYIDVWNEAINQTKQTRRKK